jgi:HD-GYP domain-containing protein (c-di-GMP phosphodiesterase class II)
MVKENNKEMFMKKLVKSAIFFLILAVLAGCKTREKQVQKSETQTETKSEATARIEEKTFEIVFDKSVLKNDFSYKNSSEETSKQEKKNVDKGKEYYENGTLKKEWERDLTEFSESSKKTFTELEERIIKEQEVSKYWEDSSNHFYKSFEQEKTKNKDYAMKLKAKETFTWQMFFVGVVLGVFLLPILRWFRSWLLRFNPYINFLEKINQKFKDDKFNSF